MSWTYCLSVSLISLPCIRLSSDGRHGGFSLFTSLVRLVDILLERVCFILNLVKLVHQGKHHLPLVYRAHIRHCFLHIEMDRLPTFSRSLLLIESRRFLRFLLEFDQLDLERFNATFCSLSLLNLLIIGPVLTDIDFSLVCATQLNIRFGR